MKFTIINLLVWEWIVSSQTMVMGMRLDKDITKLLSSMTLREKLGQMTQLNINVLISNQTSLELDPKKIEFYINEYKVGSFLNSISDKTTLPPAKPDFWLNTTNTLQAASMKNRLKIPIMYGLDSVHGANYVSGAAIFPHQLGLAATFRRELVERVGEITAKDTRAVGVHWNFSPILDIAVNKQWPRIYETFGEDPYLTSELGVAMVKGYQGKDMSKPDKVAATLKHFIGYSATRTGRDVDGAWMSSRIVNEYFRPPFLACIYAGAATTMESYSDIEGDHMVASKKYLHDMLRERMGFKGVLITDMEQINKLHEPIHIASSQEDAVRRAMRWGSIDVSMVPYDIEFIHHMENLIGKNLTDPRLVDVSVGRILTLKKKLGLLGTTGFVDDTLIPTIGRPEDVQVSLDAARESIILLENKNQVLPLKPGAKLLVTGPVAKSLSLLAGGWTYAWAGTDTDEWYEGNGTTIYQGLSSYTDDITFMESVDIEGQAINKNPFSLANFEDYDAIVLCIGESHYAEFKGDIYDMGLPKGHQDLIADTLDRTTKPVILLVSQGRPRVLGDRALEAHAILNSFLAGPYAGQAFADILFGHVNPSGRLPVTYSNRPNDNNLNYYRLFNNNWNPAPQWEFGHGLSYTTFEYTNLTLSTTTLHSPTDDFFITVTVTNTGPRFGAHTVLLYVTDLYRSYAPEVKLLRRFVKLDLSPGQSQTVSFQLHYSDFAFHNDRGDFMVEAGEFQIHLGEYTRSFEVKMGEGKLDDYVIIPE